MGDPSAALDRRIEATGGVHLAVRVRTPRGPATPVLAGHGLAANARLWDGVADELARRGHPVAAVDQRGHGRSDKPDSGYDFATLTDDLRAVTDHLGWHDRPYLAAGQSWGGNVVLELATRHPGSLVAIALVDGGTIELAHTFADWPTAESALAPPDMTGTDAGAFERMLRLRHADWPESGIEGSLANVEVQSDGTIRPWLSRPHHMVILRGLWEHRPSERYGSIRVPVLLVPAGDAQASAGRFEVSKREGIHRAESALACSVTRWVEGDHDLHAQHPRVIAELLDAAADRSIFADA